jgi:hypothetical protein
VRFSFSAQDAPLQTLRRQVADVASVSIVAHSSPDAGKVSIEVKDAPVPEVRASIARSLDRRLTRIGQIYFLGPVKSEDRGSLVRRVRRLNAELLSKITELFRSEANTRAAPAHREQSPLDFMTTHRARFFSHQSATLRSRELAFSHQAIASPSPRWP